MVKSTKSSATLSSPNLLCSFVLWGYLYGLCRDLDTLYVPEPSGEKGESTNESEGSNTTLM